MTSRRKNLLEAFKRSDAPSAAPRVSHEGSREASCAGGSAPFPAPPGARPAAPPAWLLPVAGLGLGFALGFVAGRGSAAETRAGEGAPAGTQPAPLARPSSQPRTFQKPPPATAGEVAPGGDDQRLEESALYDSRNQWTVIVASYSISNKDLAWATHYHLRDAGLSVFPPVESRNLLVVLVGAAPAAAELAGTEAAVRALVREGRKAYADAYAARIDSLIPRTPKPPK